MSIIVATYCKPCNVRLGSNDSSFFFFTIHKMDWSLTQQKPQRIVPDVNDHSFYCCACERKLSNKRSFKNYLVGVHGIHQSALKKTSLGPGTDDSNNNCQAYQGNYGPKTKYRPHLLHVHQIATSTIFAEFRKLATPTFPTNSYSTLRPPSYRWLISCYMKCRYNLLCCKRRLYSFVLFLFF